MNVHPCKGWRFAPVLATALLASPAVLAQVVASDDSWHYEASPYLWASGVDGTTRLGGTTVNTSSGFSDLLSDVDFGLTAAFDARRGRWGILFDGIYISSCPTTLQPHKARQSWNSRNRCIRWAAFGAPSRAPHRST